LFVVPSGESWCKNYRTEPSEDHTYNCPVGSVPHCT